MEETGFGVFEDKVVKNYIATEFLYDYLKDKRSVGVIDEDAERHIKYVAEPIGVVLALLPITNPTSTALFKSIVGAKTRNAMIFRPSPRAARCATRAVEILRRRPARRRDCRRMRSRSSPTRRSTSPSTCSITRALTSSGRPAVRRRSALTNSRPGSRASASGSGNAPVYVHRSADLRMAVVDMLISKTFDASVICPAEQTCVIDDPVYDALLAEFERMGAQLLTDAEVAKLCEHIVSDDGDDRTDRARPVAA